MSFEGARLPPASFYLFSYPRSGSNWLLSALTYLLGGIKAEARIPPELYPHTHGEIGPESFWIQAAEAQQEGRPLVIKSHESAEMVRALYPEGKKIYLLRDGRDVLISYYFYHQAFIANPRNKTVFPTGRRKQDLGAVSGNAVTFEPEKYAEFLQAHASEWARHVRDWLLVPGILTVRFETLKQDFERELSRIAGYLALPPTHGVREVWEEYVEHSRSLLTGDNRAFHRKGIVGDWRNYCDESIREILKAELGETLILLGYESGLDW